MTHQRMTKEELADWRATLSLLERTPAEVEPVFVPHLRDKLRKLLDSYDAADAEIASLRKVVSRLMRVLTVATQRAIERGDTCIRAGYADMNRGQFLRLVDDALLDACKAVGTTVQDAAKQAGWEYKPEEV